MKRWLWIGAGLVVAVFLTVPALRYKAGRRHAEQRKFFDAALVRYSETIKPGVSRQALEEQLTKEGVRYHQSCCTTGHRSPATLAQVGEEDVPWFCSAWPVYVAFEFTPQSLEAKPYIASDEDLLTDMHLTSRGEGCL